MIKIIPTGGLCDRLTTIESAIAFAKEQNDNQIKIEWRLSSELFCPFNKLFLPIDNVKITNIYYNSSSFFSIVRRVKKKINLLFIWNKIFFLDSLSDFSTKSNQYYSFMEMLHNEYIKQQKIESLEQDIADNLKRTR